MSKKTRNRDSQQKRAVPLNAQKKSTMFQNRPLMFETNKIFYQETFEKLRMKLLPEKPLSVEEEKNISRKLTGQELSKIIVGDTVIDFGKIFVNSKAYSFFNIKNNLRSSIAVKLNIGRLPFKTNFRRKRFGNQRHLSEKTNHLRRQIGQVFSLRVFGRRQDHKHQDFLCDQ
jgi:hypothetical protein